MSEPDYETANRNACMLVGRFLQNWARTEWELRKALQKALGLDDTQGIIVAANIQLRDKIHILRTAVDRTLTKGADEKKQIDRTLTDIADYATRNRNMMAHDMFGPSPDGTGVEFLVMKAKGKLSMPEVIWTEDDFTNANDTIAVYRVFLRDLTSMIDEAAFAKLLANLAPKEGQPGLGLLGFPSLPLPGLLGSGTDLPNPGIAPQTPPKPEAES